MQKCLPQIVKSGKIIGQVNFDLAERFNLNKQLILTSGTTDSNAGLIAADLGKEDGLTVLGTTIVVKKIIDNPIKKRELQPIESVEIGSVEVHLTQDAVSCLSSFLI